MAVKRFRVNIRDAWCKGCELCVAFCPKQVLAMHKGVARVVAEAVCIGCELCEMYCPDFAIAVCPAEGETTDGTAVAEGKNEG